MLSGENGILQKATDAKTQTGIGQEKETIALAYNSALTKKVSNGDSTPVTSSELNTELANQGASATGDTSIIVTFEKSGRIYKIDSNGNIKEKIAKNIELNLNIKEKDASTYVLEVSIVDVPTVYEWLKTLSDDELKECFARGQYGNDATWESKYGGASFSNVKEFYNYGPKSTGQYKDEYDWMIKDNKVDMDLYNSIYKKTTLTLNNNSIKVASVGEFNITNDGIYKVTAVNDEGDKGEIEENIILSEKFSTPYQETAKYTDKNGDIAYIPKGFSVGTGYFINKIETGLVITDHVDENGISDGNEFVWIPVENAIWDGTSTLINVDTSKGYPIVLKGQTPMAKLKSGSSNNYEGMGYKFAYWNSEYHDTYAVPFEIDSSNTTVYTEPTAVSYDSQNEYKSYGITQESLQTEFNKMIKSVERYKGFYVSRFELGLQNGTIPVSKSLAKHNSIAPAHADFDNSKTWYGLYQKCKDMYDDCENGAFGVKSNMIWGSQYDALINWLIETKQDISSREENYKYKKNQSIATGARGNRDEDKLNNIYDFFGCHDEWTLGAYSTNSRMLLIGTMFGFHNGNPSYVHDSTTSTRAALYIK